MKKIKCSLLSVALWVLVTFNLSAQGIFYAQDFSSGIQPVADERAESHRAAEAKPAISASASDVKLAWSRWGDHYAAIIDAPDKPIGLAFDGRRMKPQTAHQKAAWENARLSYLLGRYHEKASPENQAALLKELSEYTPATPAP